MTHARVGQPILRDGGVAGERIIELLSLCMFLPSHARLAAFGITRCN